MDNVASFRVRLVAYFVFLSLLPLAAATWAFGGIAGESETNKADARLAADARVAVGEFQRVLGEASERAAALARLPAVQRAFASDDRSALERIAARNPHVSLVPAGEATGGTASAPAREVEVKSGGRVLGRVVVAVPLDAALLARLARQAGFDPADRLFIVRDGSVDANTPTDVDRGGREWRVLAVPLLAGERSPLLATAAPRAPIDAAIDRVQRRIALAALAAVLLVALVAFVLGRSIVSSLARVSHAAAAIASGRFRERVPVRGSDEFARLGVAFNEMAGQLESRVAELAAERGRSQEALARFGEAIVAAHDLDMLLPLIVQGAMEATGAARASLVADGQEVASAGERRRLGEPMRIPLPTENRRPYVLVLFPRPGAQFGEEEKEAARSLATQAAIAVENARLHRIVQEQAVTDDLTGLANRRRFMEGLANEVARADRVGSTVALVLADLDDFKRVNDAWGHQTGDLVLEAFADVLRENVREIDLPARFGGEEFGVVLPDTDVAGGERLAERLRRGLHERNVRGGTSVRIGVSASFGVAAHPPAAGAEELLTSADAALYQAKAAGKDRVVTAAGPVRRSE